MAVETTNGVLHARVWKVGVGRTMLYLLDSNVPENTRVGPVADGAALWGRRAGADSSGAVAGCWRGASACVRCGIHPGVLHLNEGHSAFATLEMVRQMMEEGGQPFGEVMHDVSAMTVFTTHTPVAAGHDRFAAPLVEEHLGKIRESLHLSYDDFMGLGRVYPGDPNEPFCMTVLALRLSRYANGVSALHGTVSRRMWQPLFVNTAEENVPIGHITNGIHVQSWVCAADAFAL